jgi:hypothetical protein
MRCKSLAQRWMGVKKVTKIKPEMRSLHAGLIH